MKKETIRVLLFSVTLLIFKGNGFSQVKFDGTENLEFQKRELNWGAGFAYGSEQEELRSANFRQYEKLTTGAAKFQFQNRYWNYLEDMQESFTLNLEAGPFYGKGNWIDSSHIRNNIADHDVLGLRTNGTVSYNNRYFYNNKNYTIVEVSGWGRYDWFNQNSVGTSTDSNKVVSTIVEESNETKFRYGLRARAGWGIGRLNPMNHFMTADYLLDKYYKRRNFSQNEIIQFASEIGKVKHRRSLKTGHDAEKEAEQIRAFLTNSFLLETIDNLEPEWTEGEFLPRFHGNRVEFGPFFTYFNREPDFIYGGYVDFKNAKYRDYKWNRNIGVKLEYSRYKEQDWALAEFDLGWSYYIELKSRLDFGLKYAPGLVLNQFEDVGPLNHSLIPYLGYFSQINSKTRFDLSLAWRISDQDSLMMTGPEFSLSIYRSRY